MSPPLTASPPADPAPASRRFHWWPLWATGCGLLGLIATVLTDTRAGDGPSATVGVADMVTLDHELFRVGGFVGYLCVAALLVCAAGWQRRVSHTFVWSLGARVVTFGLVASAAALSLAYGWKGALGNYLHGAVEEDYYDDSGLYVYYVMNDFSPYVGWLPVTVALGALAWMAFAEGLVSRPLGAVAGLLTALITAAVAVTGVPGLPFVSMIGLVVVGIWLSVGRSPILQGGLS